MIGELLDVGPWLVGVAPSLESSLDKIGVVFSKSSIMLASVLAQSLKKMFSHLSSSSMEFSYPCS